MTVVPRTDTHNDATPETPAEGWADADLFTAQAALLRSDLPHATICLAIAVLMTGRATTGTNLFVDEAALMQVGRCSRATLYRRLSPLLGTWLVQTEAPTRGANGKPGRRARYRVRVPESCLTAKRAGETRSEQDGPESRLTSERQAETRSEASRVSREPESCLTTERGPETVLREPCSTRENYLPPTPSRSVQSPLVSVESGREDEEPNPDEHDLAAVALVESLPEPLNVRGKRQRTVSARVAARLRTGYSADALRRVLAADPPPDVRIPAALLLSRLDDLPASPSASDRARPVLPPKCADPTCGPSRRREDPETGDDLGACPTCHPSTVTAPPPRRAPREDVRPADPRLAAEVARVASAMGAS